MVSGIILCNLGMRNTSISYDGIKIHNPDQTGLLIRANEFNMEGPNDRIEITSNSLFSPGPHISIIQDGLGKSTLGCIDLVTRSGTKKSRSAASLVLFDGKGNSIWSTPE